MAGRAMAIFKEKEQRALWHAAGSGEVDEVKGMMRAGRVDVNWRTPDVKSTALHQAAMYGRAETAAALLSYGADPNVANIYGETPMHFAAKHGHPTVVAVLRRFHGDICAKDWSGTTANHHYLKAEKG